EEDLVEGSQAVLRRRPSHLAMETGHLSPEARLEQADDLDEERERVPGRDEDPSFDLLAVLRREPGEDHSPSVLPEALERVALSGADGRPFDLDFAHFGGSARRADA